MRGRAYRTSISFGALAAMMLLSAPARADAPEESAAATPGDGPGTAIVVTATRRPSPLSDVPIAISAIGGDAMQNSGATDIRGLAQLAPSLFISSTGSEANAVARIRGVGTVGDNAGLESSVAVFIDGVYRPRTGAALTELGAIERIEMMRGPQGTLFGRNASAGLISIVTKAPEFRLGANGEAGYGNYNQWRLATHVTGPLSDKVAIGVDVVHVQRDGFLDLVDQRGNRIGDTNDRNRQMVRGQLLFRPDDRTSVRLIADYTHRDESCCGAVYSDVGEETGTNPTTATANPTNRIVTLLSRDGATFPNGPTPYVQDPYQRRVSITPGRDYVSRVDDWGLSAEIDHQFDGGIKLTSITAYRQYKSSDYGDYDYSAADLIYRDPGTNRRFANFSQEVRLQGHAFGKRLDWLIGGFYGREVLNLRDNIRFGADYGRYAACRLLAGSGTSASGLLALAPDCTSPTALGALSAQLRGGGFPAALVPAITGGLTTLANIGNAGDVDSRYRQESENFALFTHNILRLTDRLSLTLGGRVTWDRKHFSAMLNNDNAACAALQTRQPGTPNDLVDIATQPAFGGAAALAGGILTLGCLGNGSPTLNWLMLEDRMRDTEFTGTAILSWRPTDTLMFYGSFARGYKAGGYNLDRFELGNRGMGAAQSPMTYFAPRTNDDARTLGYRPEHVNAYELGVKYQNGPLAINVAAFREEFGDFQLNTFNGTSFIVQNINGCGGAATSEAPCSDKPGLISQGAEAELVYAPRRDVMLTGGVTYVEARYADRLAGSSDGSEPLDPALFLLPGGRASNAPLVTVSASAGWTPPLGRNGLTGLFYVDGRYNGGYNAGSDLYPEKYQDGFLLMNARVGLRGKEERWAIELWCQNLLDTDYAQVIFNSPLQSTGPANQSVAQLGRVTNGSTTVMTNQLFSSYLGEPRTYGVTLRWKM